MEEDVRESVKKDILAILDQVIAIMEDKKESDVYEIKELSNHTIHSASIFQDTYSTSLAVLVYSLYKIIERKILDDKNYKNLLEELKYARLYLRDGKLHEYKKSMDKLFSEISRVDKQFRIFMQHVLEKARVNKGSKLYEHGLSIAKASELMGISQWELSSYVGKTAMVDIGEPETAVNVRKRIAVALKAFGVE